MKQLKKVLAIFLCLAMCFSLFPTWAVAEEEQEAVIQEVTEVAESEDEGPVYEENIDQEIVNDDPVSEASVYNEPVFEVLIDEGSETQEFVNEEPTNQEPVDDETAAEEPVNEAAGSGESESVKPVRVVFDVSAESAAVRVFTRDEYLNENEIIAEEDGSWLLLPGQYYYTVQAEGFETIDETELTVDATEEIQIVTVTLEEAQTVESMSADNGIVLQAVNGTGISFYVQEDRGADDGDLLAKYAAQELERAKKGGVSPQAPARPTSGLNAAQIEAYVVLESRIKETAKGERPSAVYEVTFDEDFVASNLTWTPETLPDGEYSFTSFTAENCELAAEQAFEAVFNLDLLHIALLNTLPYELYWFDKTTGIYATYHYSTPEEEASPYSRISIDEVTYYFIVANTYSDNTHFFTIYNDGSWEVTEGSGTYPVGVRNVGSRIEAAIENAQSVVDSYSAYSDLDKLRLYKDWICAQVDYDDAAVANDYDLGYGDPWQLINVFDNDSSTDVVCEGYSKAFEYLCDLEFGEEDPAIRCYLATGTMIGGTGAGAHMWNIVTMDDGNNYLVDVTNCDTGSAGAPELLFLKGCVSGSADTGYLFSCYGNGIRYIYDEETLGYYNTDELTLSASDYVVPALVNRFEQLKTAIANGDSYFELNNTGSVVIEENLTIPANMNVDAWGTEIIVPTGVTLTVDGFLGMKGLVIEGAADSTAGGLVHFGDDAHGTIVENLNLGQGAALDIGRNAGVDISVIAWNQMSSHTGIGFEDESSRIFLNSEVRSDEQLEKALGDAHQVRLPNGDEDHFVKTFNIYYNWKPTDEFIMDSDIDWHIVNTGDEVGSITVEAGNTLTLNSYLCLHSTAMTVEGTFVNEGWIDLQDDGSGMSRITLNEETGSCFGMGEIHVWTVDNPKSCLQGFDEDSLHEKWNNGDGVCYVYTAGMFEAFKAACETGKDYCDLNDLSTLTIKGDLTVPANMHVDFWGTELAVPEGVTLTILGSMDGSALQIAGTVDVNGGHLHAQDIAFKAAEATLNLGGANGGGLSTSADSWTDAVKTHVRFGQDSYLNLNMEADNFDAYLAANDAIAGYAQEDHVTYWVHVRFELMPPEGTYEQAENVVYDFHDGGSMRIQPGVTYILRGGLQLRGSAGLLDLRGSLVNEGWLGVEGDDSGMGQVVLNAETGSYSGTGEIRVWTHNNPTSCLDGFDADSLQEKWHNGDGFCYIYTAGVFEAFKAACESGRDYYNLQGLRELTIKDNLTIPANMHTDAWDTVITIPAGKTLTVNGELGAHAVVIEESGTMAVGDNAQVHINGVPNATVVDGTITLSGNSSLNVSLGHWMHSNIKDGIQVNDRDAEIHVQQMITGEYQNDFNNLLDMLRSIEIPENLEDGVRKEFSLAVPWTPEDGFVMDDSVNWHIQNNGRDQFGSLTVPADSTLTVNGYLGLHGAAMTVDGTLVNNRDIELRRDDERGPAASLSLSRNALYQGAGEIRVFHSEPACELIDFTETLTESYSDEYVKIYRSYGELLEALKAAIAAGDGYFDLNGKGRFTLTENLEIPRGMHVDFWGTELVIPESVTLTIRGSMSGESTEIGGTVDVPGGDLYQKDIRFSADSARLNLSDGSASIPGAFWTDEVKGHVRFDGENSRLSLNYEARTIEELAGGITERINSETDPHIGHWISVFFPYALAAEPWDEWDIAENVVMEFCAGNEGQNGSMTIPEGVTVIVYGGLKFNGGTLTIGGTLINNNWIEFAAENDSRTMGSASLAGTYSGPGEIRVKDTTSPKSWLQGFDPDSLEERWSDGNGVCYIYTAGLFAWLKAAVAKAAADGSEFYHCHMDGVEALRIEENLTIPANMSVDAWDTVITVPAGNTLTVNGRFHMHAIVIEERAALALGDGAEVNLNGNPTTTEVNGAEAIRLDGDNCNLNLGLGHWMFSNIKDGIRVNGQDAMVHVNVSPRQDDFGNALAAMCGIEIPAELENSVYREFHITFHWNLTGNFTVPEGINFHISDNGEYENGRLTVPRGVTLVNNSYLALHSADMIVNGTLINNGFLDLRQDNGSDSRLNTGSGASITGDGTFRVCTDGDPQSLFPPEVLDEYPCSGHDGEGYRYEHLNYPYTVVYDANNGNGDMEAQTVEPWSGETARENPFIWELNRWIGWNTEADGSGIWLAAGDAFPREWSSREGQTYTLYAQWQSPETYTVVLDGNGHVTAADGAEQIVLEIPVFDAEHEEIPLPLQVMRDGEGIPTDEYLFVPEGDNFVDWNTLKSGEGKSYGDGACLRNLREMSGNAIILYAQWDRIVIGEKWIAAGGKETLAPDQLGGTKFTWSISEADAEYASVSAKGEVTAKAVTETHDVTVTATAADGAKQKFVVHLMPAAQSILIWEESEENVISVKTINWRDQEEAALEPDGSLILRLGATVQPAGAPDAVTWAAANPKNVTVAKVAEDGTLHLTGQTGTATLTVKCNAFPKITASMSITVVAAKAEDIEILSPPDELRGGDSATLSARLEGSTLIWGLAEGSEAYATLTEAGKLTTREVGRRTTITALVWPKENPDERAEHRIDLLPTVQAIYLATDSATIWTGDSFLVTAAVLPESATQNGTWKVSSTASAVFIEDDKTVTVNGKPSATYESASGEVSLQALKAGSVTLTFTAADNSKKSASLKITIVDPPKTPVETLSIDDKDTVQNRVLEGGETLTLKTTIVPAKPTNPKVVWSVDNPDAITVSNGKVTAKKFYGTEPVIVTVTATAADGCGAKDSLRLIVKPTTGVIPVGDIEILGQPAMLTGTSQTLKATLTPANPSNKILRWSSADESIATVTQKGVVTAKVVDLVCTVPIKAEATDGSGISKEFYITVYPKATGVTIFRDNTAINNTTQILDLSVSETVKLFADVYPLYKTMEQDVTWTSSSTKIAEIDSEGVITGHSAGTTTITATAKDGSKVNAGFKLTVRTGVQELSVKVKDGLPSQPARIRAGTKLNLLADFGSVVPTNQKVTWSLRSEDAAYATVSNGVLTAKKVTSIHQVVVTAASAENPEVRSDLKVTVYPSANSVSILCGDDVITGMTISPLQVGNEIRLSAVCNPVGSEQKVEWKLSSTKYAGFAGNGTNAAYGPVDSSEEITIQALSKGKITLTATAQDGSKKAGKITINIVEPG